jgi:hypothetical protein
VIRRAIAVTVLLVGSMSSTARATPLVAPHVGGLFAGPTSPGVSGIFWNPAAQGLMRGTHILFSGDAQLQIAQVHRAPIDTRTGEPADLTTPDGDRASFGTDTLTPITPGGFVGLVTDFGTDSVTLGLASYTPFAQALATAPDLRYHTDGGYFYSLYNSISVSFRATSRLIFGGGIDVIHNELSLRFTQDTQLPSCDGTTSGCVENSANDRSYDLALGSGNTLDQYLNAFGWKVGVMYRATSRLWLGLSYLSQPRTFGNGSVHLDVSGSATITQFGETFTAHPYVRFSIPEMLNIGARYELVPADIGSKGLYAVASLRWIAIGAHDAYDIQLFGVEQGGTAVTTSGIPSWQKKWRGFGWLPIVGGMVTTDVGLEQAAGAQWRLGAHLRLSTPGLTTSAVAPDQIDGWSAELAGGLEVRLSTDWTLSLAAAAGAMLPQTVSSSGFSPSSAIACTQSGYDLDTCADARRGSASPTAAGDYHRYDFDVMVGLSFDRL